jgi:hypothetical protein
MDTYDDDQVPNLEKEERQKQNPMEMQGINRGFCFGDQDTIESVITYRVDGHIIKRDS